MGLNINGPLTIALSTLTLTGGTITQMPLLQFGTQNSVAISVEPAFNQTPASTQFAAIIVNATATGTFTLVAALASNKTRVMNVALVLSACGAAAPTITWMNGTNSASGAMNFVASGSGYTLAANCGLLETNVNSALALNLSAAGTVTGHLAYIQHT